MLSSQCSAAPAPQVRCDWDGDGATLAVDGTHSVLLSLPPKLATLDLSCLFAPPAAYPLASASTWQADKSAATAAALEHGVPPAAQIIAASAKGWETFWTSGAFVDLACGPAHNGPKFAEAAELERRVVLSLYLTRAHSAGAMPPQETGLAANSWYGKHHHEMRWWHQVSSCSDGLARCVQPDDAAR